jgi:tRNA threonylcarbamoyladenosine biosynthesis protein TsaB
MPSFHQLSPLFPALLIDAASAQIQVGLLRAGQPPVWHASMDEAGVAVFRGIEHLDVDPMGVSAFVFCDGPGSVLGIRTAAMALRTWNALRPRPMFAYTSLALVAHALGRPDVGVIADARRESWHHYAIGRGLRRIPTADLAGELLMPDHFRHWSNLPADTAVARVPYSLASLLPNVWDVDLLRETDAPDAFLHEEPRYVTWTPHVHQAAADNPG